MLTAILAPLIGLLGSFLPALIQLWQKKQDYTHELDLAKLNMEAATRQGQIQLAIENVKADVAEGESLRSHDAALDGGVIINTLKASIRPVITYIFFGLFVAVKLAAAITMIRLGQNIPEMLKAVWDTETMALFGAVIAFWFGSRVQEKISDRNIGSRTSTVKPLK